MRNDRQSVNHHGKRSKTREIGRKIDFSYSTATLLKSNNTIIDVQKVTNFTEGNRWIAQTLESAI